MLEGLTLVGGALLPLVTGNVKVDCGLLVTAGETSPGLTLVLIEEECICD